MQEPGAVRTAVRETESIYQIFIRNYTEEGTLRAAIGRLDEVRALRFDWVYLTPIHPIGRAARKGTLGSPYAIADYRLVDPDLGTIDDFRSFVKGVHERGMKLMIDVVYNHTSPDSRLAVGHPEWFLSGKRGVSGARGKPGRKCEDWSDVVDFDFSSSHDLWDELIETLVYWREQGVDGFRCDVASLVSADFWREARRRVNDEDPKTGEEQRPTLWLAESVHPSFLLSMRDRGFGGWSDGELHAAFDLTYDYDGWEQLERVWSGTVPLSAYLGYLETQRALSPASARKIRYLENHDQRRAADRFGAGARLRAWTVFYQLLPGSTFAYMGQEYAIDKRPSLFEREPVQWKDGDRAFRDFFSVCFAATQRIKGEAPRFSWKALGEGVVLIERRGTKSNFAALLNLDDRSGRLELSESLIGVDLLTGNKVNLSGLIELPRGALVVERSAAGTRSR
jgi:glycosidase